MQWLTIRDIQTLFIRVVHVLKFIISFFKYNSPLILLRILVSQDLLAFVNFRLDEGDFELAFEQEKGQSSSIKCRSLSCGEDLINVLDGDVLSAGLFATLVELHLELEAVLSGVDSWEGACNHSGVGEEDAVEGQTGTLDGMLIKSW